MTVPSASSVAEGLFVFWIAVTVLGALMAVLTARIIRSVCGLAVCCVGLASLFYCLGSPFLALMEILIYVGAVCVTIVFGVMLAEPDEPPKGESSLVSAVWGGLALLVGAGVFAGLAWIAVHARWAAPAEHANDGSIQALGVSLLTTYGLAFELISVALLVAILGALAIARSGRYRT